MNTILVVAELANEKLAMAGLEQLALARRLAPTGTVIALLLGADKAMAEALIARGADQVVLGTRKAFDGYNSDGWTACAAAIAREHAVTLVLAAHTPRGADLAPRLAFRLNAGCATGCVGVEQKDGTLHFTRASHGGNVRETLRFETECVVATVRALKHHGGVAKDALNQENLPALEKGLANLERHVNNVKNVYGIPCVVSVNRFTADTQAEMDLLTKHVAKLGVKVVVATHWADGGAGAADVAKIVVDLCNEKSSPTFVYEDSDPLWEKMKKVATKVYGAADITADTKVRNRIKELQEGGYGHYPVCVAKTQSSFSTDPNLRGAPSGHIVNIREVRLAAGAEFVVMVCGDIMTMPGLPKVPSAEKIDLTDDGKVVGLF